MATVDGEIDEFERMRDDVDLVPFEHEDERAPFEARVLRSLDHLKRLRSEAAAMLSLFEDGDGEAAGGLTGARHPRWSANKDKLIAALSEASAFLRSASR